jgi:hypothetical protein
MKSPKALGILRAPTEICKVFADAILGDGWKEAKNPSTQMLEIRHFVKEVKE